MVRYCAECGDWCGGDLFSNNQWRKGNNARCLDCVNGTNNNAYQYVAPTYECDECHRTFGDQNQLTMHMQVHRPRNVACPVCHEQRFASGANAVQHVESGYCTGCRGTENARDSIYKFAQQQRGMRPHMANVPMLTNGSHNSGTPDFPYQCNQCQKSFRQMSQLLQHNDAKHGQTRLLSY
mmetsp:Transcript_11022/g.18276  ORF Transcript_11022/g.18276 Transcript_11022/m.18276 type:complete len:180 (-) Transcript_11022:206-745(-)|eukprot:CAMPEP_0119003892 /NCGR_PEP_ID=MMETSP1176-20130426/825_1 /TAXON_ID=265551 /ORGANISM="Synedropsis recta cf, Strain CCMP1620" /LENGTH=179 /DNA_ID=CAMNT_0006955533 /DNA_START=162 /DNA_END=701 /DNA_ORIENTATION=+